MNGLDFILKATALAILFAVLICGVWGQTPSVETLEVDGRVYDCFQSNSITRAGISCERVEP